MSSTDASDPQTNDGKRRTGTVTAVIALALSAIGFVLGLSLRPEAEPPEPVPTTEATTPMDRETLTREFQRLYYRALDTTWNNTYWLGVPTLKCPLDLWIFQEILYETRPDRIIETGTFKGGSAFYMASLLDMIGNGHILTIDIEEHENKPTHGRITYLLGSSTSEEIFEKAQARSSPAIRSWWCSTRTTPPITC